MPQPVVIINCKIYQQVEGRGASSLASICASVREETGANLIICPPMVELARVAEQSKVPVFSQDVDPFVPGSGTGFTSPSLIKATGAVGTLVNHSEHKKPAADVGKCVSMCRELGLTVCACADTKEIAAELAGFSPEYIAVEPPELIGGDISVTTANPDIVSGTVDAVGSVDRKVKVLCGAGVKNGKDVQAAVALGAHGVLLASGVVKAKDPEAVIRDLVGFI